MWCANETWVYCKCKNHHHDPSTIRHQSTSAAISQWVRQQLIKENGMLLSRIKLQHHCQIKQTHPHHQCPISGIVKDWSLPEGPTRRIEGHVWCLPPFWSQRLRKFTQFGRLGEFNLGVLENHPNTYSHILKHQKDTFLETRKSIWPSISWPSKLPSLFWCLHQTSWTLWFLPAGQIRWMRSQNHGPPAVFLTCSYVYKRNIHNCMCIVLHTYARIHVCVYVCVCVRIVSIKVKISNQNASNPHCGASVCCSVFTPNNYKNVPGERTYLVTWERYTKWISHVSMSNSICQPHIYDMVSSCRTPDWLIWLIHSKLIDISLLQSYKKACPQISIDDTSI